MLGNWTAVLGLAVLHSCLLQNFQVKKAGGEDNPNTYVSAETILDEDGVKQAKVSSDSTVNQKIAASEESSIKGSEVTFPPGSLAADTEITVQEGSSLVEVGGIPEEHGIDSEVESAGPAVSVSSSDGDAIASDYNLKINLPSDSGLTLDTELKNLVIFYVVTREGKNFSGIVLRSEITISDSFANFTANAPGIFQAVMLKDFISSAKEQSSNQPILTKVEGDKIANTKLTITSHTANSFVVGNSENPIKLAGECSFSGEEVQILKPTSAKATCKNGKWSKEIDITSSSDGKVTFTLQHGPEVDPLAISIVLNKDSKAPTIPKELGDGGTYTQAAIGFTWEASTDTGAGLKGYEISLGSAQDTFDLGMFPIGTNSYSYSGSIHGQQVFARVRSVDKIGNISSWSSVSNGIVIDKAVDTAASGLTISADSVSTTHDLVDDEGEVFLSWTAADDNGSGIVGYTLHFYSSVDCTGNATEVTGLTATNTSLTGLTDGFYSFKVTAMDALSNQLQSSCSSAIKVSTTAAQAVVGSFVASNIPGALKIALDYPDFVDDYQTVELRRMPGATAPADCSSGFAIETISSDFTDQEIEHLIGGLSRSYSYRICVTDIFSRVSSSTLEDVKPRYNAGPGCMVPPCDPPKGTIALSAVPSTTSFLSAANISGSPRCIAMGDFDKDGNLDAVVGTHSTDVTYVLMGNGAGGFTVGPLSGETLTTQAIEVGDVNNDGILDVVTGDKVYTGNGDGTFAESDNLSELAIGIALGDVNRDGNLDILLGFTSAKILLGNGDGTFQAGTTLGSNTDSAYDVALADLNGDGYLDAVKINQNPTAGASDLVFINAGNGTFGGGTSLSAETFNGKTVEVADLDGDGNFDLVIMNNTGDGIDGDDTSKVYYGNGDGTFAASQNLYDNTTNHEWGVLVDMYARDRFDMVGFSLLTKIYDWDDTGDTHFTSNAPSSFAVCGGGSVFGGAVGDIDNDGILDFMSACANGGNDSVRAFLGE